MTTTIHDEAPPDLARLAELVYDQGDALATLTRQVADLLAYMQRTCEAAGLPGPGPSPRRALRPSPLRRAPRPASWTVLDGGAR